MQYHTDTKSRRRNCRQRRRILFESCDLSRSESAQKRAAECGAKCADDGRCRSLFESVTEYTALTFALCKDLLRRHLEQRVIVSAPAVIFSLVQKLRTILDFSVDLMMSFVGSWTKPADSAAATRSST